MTASNLHIGHAGRLVRRVAGLLREELRQASPGEALPPADEMTRRYRCSMTTVRSALAMLRQEGLIETAHGVGSFVARPAAGRGVVGLLWFGSIRNLVRMEYFRQITFGIMEEADACGKQLHLMPAKKRSPVAVRIADLQDFPLGQVESVISAEVFNRPLLALLGSRMITVSIDFDCHEPGVSSCALDHAATMRQLVEPLWMLGHRRIGMVGPVTHVTDPAHAARRDAFLAELRGRGVAADANWLFHSSGSSASVTAADAYCAMPRSQRPTALITTVADVDWWLLGTLLARGVRIPQDLSVVSIRVSQPWITWARELWALRLEPDAPPPSLQVDPMDEKYAPLRSMMVAGLSLPFGEMGRWAVREAQRRSADPASQPEHKSFGGEFLPGNTLAPPPTG
ncbi:MAG: substrate-binding domain-containing protein [Phycisphaerae bacterium]|nr:substrate-binding domain-containing protein [Phycisphaerae bacterium]